MKVFDVKLDGEDSKTLTATELLLMLREIPINKKLNLKIERIG